MALPTYELTVDLNEIDNMDYDNAATTVEVRIYICRACQRS